MVQNDAKCATRSRVFASLFMGNLSTEMVTISVDDFVVLAKLKNWALTPRLSAVSPYSLSLNMPELVSSDNSNFILFNQG